MIVEKGVIDKIELELKCELAREESK